jgi:hypothetical protein
MELRKRAIVFLAVCTLANLSCPALQATHIRGGYITATLIDNNNLTYRITLSSLTDTGSTVLFGGGQMDFGDGSEPVMFEAGNPDYFELLDPQVALCVFETVHSFPGPGEYTIGYREFNRNASIANMDNSVNTSFYVETTIVIDPYMGPNSSARILNYFPFNNKLNAPYVFPVMARDPDGDSISIEPTIPLMDLDEPVRNYFVPSNFEGNRIISQMQLHVPANDIVWANPLEEDEYNFAVKILEWRFSQSVNSWINVGHTVFDFQIIIQELTDQKPVIRNFGDTAILASQPFNSSFTILDDAADTLKIIISDNLPGMHEFQTDFDQELYYATPFTGNFSINNPETLLRPDPYKIVISVNPKGYSSTALQESVFIWVSDKTGIPPAPAGLKMDLAFRDRIMISWEDQSENEAGFTVERADSFFPDFIRIAALPENATGYSDGNVIPNRDYYYRVRAIGTGGSSYSEILEVREMDIITGSDDPNMEEDFLFYPNPAKDHLEVRFNDPARLPVSLQIIDLKGKSMFSLRSHEYSRVETTITIPVMDLSSGIYFLILDYDGFRSVRKFLKL